MEIYNMQGQSIHPFPRLIHPPTVPNTCFILYHIYVKQLLSQRDLTHGKLFLLVKKQGQRHDGQNLVHKSWQFDSFRWITYNTPINC